MEKEYNWAFLGTGAVANTMASAMRNAGKNIYAVGSRTYENAVAFAEKYNIKKIYNNFEEMFTDKNVDIIYIATPHNTHIQFLRKALGGGKNVLCEKAITLNSKELDETVELAKENNVVLAEAMTLFHMPLYKRLNQIVSSGKLGKVNMIQMSFGSYKEYDMSNRFFNRSLAGGALLDIGVYAISFVRWFMSEKPDNILSQVRYAPSGVDEQAGILMMNGAGEMASVTLTLHSKQPKRGVVSCDKGYIEIMEYPKAEEAVITYTETGEREVINIGRRDEAMKYEMEDMEKAVSGNTDDIHMDYTKDVMDIMTKIREDWEMFYPEEE